MEKRMDIEYNISSRVDGWYLYSLFWLNNQPNLRRRQQQQQIQLNIFNVVHITTASSIKNENN
ncbi:hypothetical protein DERP_008877 [Dermatophagoides pteronyssinus]|uniref:Uncharacterized protein n=1 Tax=Dermatophagoides pteronyssinus TaxID=6956 RepID=A0ABQ8JN38_DERPT|nr:hypothetical protein DERP_008877 [Dermatophagoides pteronyssinus]